MADSLTKAKAKLRADSQERALRVPSRSRLRRALTTKWMLRVLVWGGALVLWQIVAIVKGPFYAPTLQATVLGIGDAFANGYYWTLLESLRQMIIGYFLALLIAIPLGALMGRFHAVDDFFSPFVNTLFVTSKESLIPLFVIAFGTSLGYRVAVVVLFAFFFPVMNTAAGVRFVDQKFVETARAFCTARRRMFTQIYLPAAAPFVVAGTRLGLGMAFKGFVIAEIWIVSGTGRLLVESGSLRLLDTYFAIAFVIAALGVGSNEALKALERRLRPYAQLEAQEAEGVMP